MENVGCNRAKGCFFLEKQILKDDNGIADMYIIFQPCFLKSSVSSRLFLVIVNLSYREVVMNM